MYLDYFAFFLVFRYAVTAWYKQNNVISDSPNQDDGKEEIGRSLKARGSRRIFVSIASYRDPECQWTLASLFKNADYPDLTYVGIVWQYKPDLDTGFVRLAGDQKWINHVSLFSTRAYLSIVSTHHFRNIKSKSCFQRFVRFGCHIMRQVDPARLGLWQNVYGVERNTGYKLMHTCDSSPVGIRNW